MEDAKTRSEAIQNWFKNSWIGIAATVLIAILVFLSQVGDAVKKLGEWVLPAPAADLRPIVPTVAALDKFADKVTRVGAETVYPVGATFQFNLVHDRAGEEVIGIDGLDARVDAYDPQAICPFTLTGDRVFGHGEAPLRLFTVHMADGKVSSVQRKDQRDGPMRRGRSSNLLAIDPPLSLVVRKGGDDIEKIVATFIVDDPGQYKVGLSVRYSNRSGSKTASLPAATICTPRR